MRAFVVLSLIAVSAACSQAHIPKSSRITAGELVTCRRVTPTGSHRMQTVCTSAAERDKQEKDSRAYIEEVQRQHQIEESMREAMRRQEPVGRP